MKRTSRTVISHLVVAWVGAVLRATHTLLKAIGLPELSKLGVSALWLAIFYQLNGKEGEAISLRGKSDEIVNNALLEIATD